MFDLVVEYFEDLYEEHPKEMLELDKDSDGNIRWVTGDPLIDKWERMIELGMDPDLKEGLPKDIDDKLESSTFDESRFYTPLSNVGPGPQRHVRSKSIREILNKVKK